MKGLTPQDDSIDNDNGGGDNATPSQIGDIITAVDGHPVRQIDDIINHIESQKGIGDNIKLTVNRNGEIMDLTVNLQARPQITTTGSPSSEDQNQLPDFGGLIPKLPHIPGFPKLPRLPSLLP